MNHVSFKLSPCSYFERRFLPAIATVVSGVILTSGVAFADGVTAVDALETETAKVSDIYTSVQPVAIGSTVFGIGAVMIKRIAFA